ncbi:hypothetical protein SKAU_G00375980 [Synaphobranchus kaupii]|uniref:Uncharacterized protein n=1 Tax=Synaphobranchus kaupii TaxID=118154 RepID=A0A9Q1ECN3_SYNKA|nr:hypothetical protein SKAU_G00375980 [Synaphobranchus kaupii]
MDFTCPQRDGNAAERRECLYEQPNEERQGEETPGGFDWRKRQRFPCSAHSMHLAAGESAVMRSSSGWLRYAVWNAVTGIVPRMSVNGPSGEPQTHMSAAGNILRFRPTLCYVTETSTG